MFVFLILLTIATFQTVYAYHGVDEQSAIELTETDFIDLFDSNNNQFKINDYPNLYGEGFVIHNHYFKEIPQEPDPENPDEPLEPVYEKTPRFPVTIYHDDPIVKIIPKKELTEIGQKLKIGREYGYFVDTNRESNYLISTVLVFDVMTNTDLLNNNDRVSVTVMPLYQYEVVAVSKSHTSFERKFTNRSDTYIFEYEINFDDDWGIFAYPSISSDPSITTFMITFGSTEKYFLKDVSFGATMYNENELNREDMGYNPYNDNGAFFIGAYYEYEGSIYSSGNDEGGMFLLDLIQTGIGYADKIPPLFVATLIWDIVDLSISANNYIQNRNTFDSVQNNISSIGLQLYNITKPHQIANYGQLQKMISLVVNTDESGAIFRNSQFAKASYMINNTNPTGLPDYTRFYSNIGLSISDKDGNKIMTEIASHDFYFGDESIKSVEINDYTQISLLPGGQKVLEFTPNHSGYYYFDTNGTQNTELEIIGTSITEIQVLRNTNKKIRAHLKAGVTYKIVTSYEDDE